MSQRRASAVPWPVTLALACALALQIALKSFEPPPQTSAADLPFPPSNAVLRLSALGDPVPVAKVLMLYLQAFDLHAGNRLPYRALDYDRLIDWLGQIVALDPAGQYPLHAASRIYAEVPDREKQRKMLDFVFREFFVDPEHRWPWLAQAATIAKHQLGDLPLARRYAAAIQQNAKGPTVPLWARQMEAFILEDMDELETARIMIGGYVSSGQIHDPGELRFLEGRLREIEERIAARRRH